MDWPNNQHSMFFRCEVTWKEFVTQCRHRRRHSFLSRFRGAAIRDARRRPGIIVRARRKRAVAARGTAGPASRRFERAVREPHYYIGRSAPAVGRVKPVPVLMIHGQSLIPLPDTKSITFFSSYARLELRLCGADRRTSSLFLQSNRMCVFHPDFEAI